MHSQAIPLVFRTESGNIVPTGEYRKLSKALPQIAKRQGHSLHKFQHALQDQLQQQQRCISNPESCAHTTTTAQADA